GRAKHREASFPRWHCRRHFRAAEHLENMRCDAKFGPGRCDRQRFAEPLAELAPPTSDESGVFGEQRSEPGMIAFREIVRHEDLARSARTKLAEGARQQVPASSLS